MDISIKISISQSIIIAKSAKNILNLTRLPVNNMEKAMYTYCILVVERCFPKIYHVYTFYIHKTCGNFNMVYNEYL